jgi:RNase P subunit RPR2
MNGSEEIMPTEELGIAVITKGLLCGHCYAPETRLKASVATHQGQVISMRIECTACGNIVEWKHGSTDQ